ncbi:DUF2062 domain-containing protein [Manganibacter manganicus]|uniref:DUF2062 domain-containing protein n=1 Tax=Manganibacter manganicus TaxID=1873176 RepID=A0A1V8RK06_9HYPH|nr:DUF2062 domain-containing protein [Pseudaminobacter manganicus]OQM73542.1 hypothetical protein BFN67_08045 [Pseudaminobacter manganicus]
MLFRRRVSESYWERFRLWLWPRRSFSRSLQYFLKRIFRLKATPHAVAAGVASGVFASFFPLGVHFIIAAAVSYMIAGNLVAAILGTALGNPVTFPFLWGASWETGKLMLHHHLPHHGTPAHLGAMLHDLTVSQLWGPILKPMLVGAVPLGIATGLIFYAVTRWGVGRFQDRRRKRFAERLAKVNQAACADGGIGSPAQ